jgi:hypothetical protein
MSAPRVCEADNGKSSYPDIQNREWIIRLSMHPYRTVGHCFFSGIQVLCSPQAGVYTRPGGFTRLDLLSRQ